MLIATIPVNNYSTAKQQIAQIPDQVDGIELRLDYADQLNLTEITELRNTCKLPVIFTLRKITQGGHYKNTEAQRLKDILDLCSLNPDYVDLEFDTPENFLQLLTSAYPKIKLIASYHDFHSTPDDLSAILQSMQKPYFYSYKIATLAQSTSDCLRMLIFVAAHKEIILTGICMGEYGQASRLLSPIVGNAMHYAPLDATYATAPGQLSVKELLTIYHFHKLNAKTKIYALLGDPVDQSVGHILHNKVMHFLNQNAVYIKMRINTDELANTIKLFQQLAFSGFSITMPLKEAITKSIVIEKPFQHINAINSIINQDQQYLGFNTDGHAVMQAIAERVDITQQKIVIIGAGGAARAIAYAASLHQAEIIILNRNFHRAKVLADELGGTAYNLQHATELKKMNYTVIINTLPDHAYTTSELKNLFHPSHLIPNTLAMDTVYFPINTQFLQIAKQANCVLIPGSEMYIHQAMLQIKRWFQPEVKQLAEINNMMQQHFLAMQN